MEYRYITQDVIDSGRINITSPEMFAEAQDYNRNAAMNYVKRRRSIIFIRSAVALQMFVPIAVTILFILKNGFEGLAVMLGGGSLVSAPEVIKAAAVITCTVGIIAHTLIYGYYVGYRKCRTAKMMFVTSLAAVLVSPVCIAFSAANYFIGRRYEQTESELREAPGYPNFVQLYVSTIESTANDVDKLTYDSIRERAREIHGDDCDFL